MKNIDLKLPALPWQEIHPSFRPSHATLLLADFTRITRTCKNVVELGCGIGTITFVLAERYPFLHLVGLDVDKTAVEMAHRFAKELNLESRISFMNLDVREVERHFPAEVFDAVIFNPPYHVEGQSSHDPDRRRVREASLELLEGFVRAANYLVKNRGRVFTAVKPQVFMHLVHFMQRFRLEPKRLRFAHGKLDKRAFLVLIESMKNGGREVLVEPPYIVEL